MTELALLTGLSALAGAGVVLLASVADADEHRRDTYRASFLFLLGLAGACLWCLTAADLPT